VTAGGTVGVTGAVGVELPVDPPPPPHPDRMIARANVIDEERIDFIRSSGK
jgi:hypothetical protein